MGFACDVTKFEQVQALWNAAKVRFGKVDIWINNAGINAGQIPFWQLRPDHIQSGVETNLIGAMNGAAVAIGGMLEQGSGAVYSMEGLGSNGRRIKGLTLYGTTKYGLAYLTDALAGETRGTPVIVGAIRPGMVVTDLLTKPFEGKPAEWERAKKVFNVLAERIETVTPWIADKVLANSKAGIRIQWLTPSRIGFCVLRALFSKRDLFRR
jgi:NAD(P)-dependent dehydrogenase (short-subunit alcohol dehydrogenase family)